MESSEDDAGTATNSSRRASAREKDVGLAQNVCATGSFQQEPSDARQSCRTPAMSEENFDGDSVPSPSTQDVNTSTEAILDMIDEIVDGPGAPKRLPLPSEAVDAPHEQPATSQESSIVQESTKSDGDGNFVQPKVPSPPAGAESENTQPAVPEKAPSSPCDDRPIPNVDTGSGDLSKESSCVPESGEPTVSLSEALSVKQEMPAECSPPIIPSNSEEQTVQRVMDISECVAQERTVKCVTSSDNRDNITVESAESTSSDSVSEGRPVIVESQTRSPLRRRLVRPIVCDRRPDSTVSSTVDSQTVNALTAEQPSSDSIAKDVSSSSDAVPIIHGNVKPEEIRNVSEISICKAETSVSPPKKIKLIRQKTISGSSHRDTPHNQTIVSTDKDQCQSTSSDNQLIQLPEATPSSSNPPESLEAIENTAPIKDCKIKEASTQNAEPVSSDEHSHQPANREPEVRHGNKQVLPIDLSNSISNLPSVPDTAIGHVPQKNSTSCALDLSGVTSDTSKINDSEQVKTRIHLEQMKNKVLPLHTDTATSNLLSSSFCDADNCSEILKDDQKKVPPIKLNLSMTSLTESKIEAGESKQHTSISRNNVIQEETKQVPKLTIKLKQSEEMKSPIPKVTIKPIRPPEQHFEDSAENIQPVPSVTKLNIKPILKPPEINDKGLRSQHSLEGVDKFQANDQIPCISKLNIKPILKPPEKINDVHRKSSSSEISESEYSENDDSTSTSDQTSASEQGPSDVVPKVTIKLGKPGTHSEGKFYTEQNIPKLTIKGIQQDDREDHERNLKLVISQPEDKQREKIPKITIKTVTKTESQPLSPKLTIKPLKPPDSSKESEIPKAKICTESFSSSSEVRENTHVPKITIKPVTRSEADTVSRTPKKNLVCNSPENIPVVTKLNIKPVLKPTESGETSKSSDDKVPVVSKLNIKPIVKPKDNDVDSSVDEVPKVTKLNIKPIKNPEESSSEKKDCDELNAVIDVNSIPVVTKINIKPIVKPHEEDSGRDGENQSSETGNSSDDNTDHIPIVTKLNIKPILKPDNLEESSKSITISESNMPVITKLNIKPLIKPGESISPSSPKKDHLRSPDHHNTSPIPIVTKLNIKPVVKPEEIDVHKSKESDEQYVRNPPLVMKINMKSVIESSHSEAVVTNEHSMSNNISEELTDPSTESANDLETTKSELINLDHKVLEMASSESEQVLRPIHSPSVKQHKLNCIPDSELESIDNDRTKVVKSPPIPKLKPDDSIKVDIIHESGKHKKCDSLLMIDPLYNEKLGEGSKPNEENKSDAKTDIINVHTKSTDSVVESNIIQPNKQKISSVQNCTLLKRLLENTKESLDRGFDGSNTIAVNCALSSEQTSPVSKNVLNCEKILDSDKINSENVVNIEEGKIGSPNKINDSSFTESSDLKLQEISENANITKPLEITISDKVPNQGSGQDSPRIILKINKTDYGSSAKIITEDLIKRPDTPQEDFENTQDIVNDKSPKRQLVNSRRKQVSDAALSLSAGKRLRSSRIVENTEKTPIVRRNVGKRPSISETSPLQNKEPELSVLQTKRLKLGQLLSGNNSLTITPTPVTIQSQTSPTKTGQDMKQGVKTINHSLLNNENCSKNGNSKLHNILSNLQAKQMHSLSLNNTNCMDKIESVSSVVELNSQQSSGSSSTVEHIPVENTHPEVQEMIINENTDFQNFSIAADDSSRDPLEVANVKTIEVPSEEVIVPKVVEMTPQPKKRGRPRKFPLSEGAKPSAVTLPVPALEERPQRSLRLMRDRPTILQKPRGRGRGRGRPPGSTALVMAEPIVVIEPTIDQPEDKSTPGEIDPTSSRIKLPRMTEALDKMPSVCTTPLSSRRRDSSGTFAGDTPELKVMLENTLPKLEDSFTKSPEASGSGRGRGGRGRGGRGRTPRARGRGRGGGRGAMYMKETMGIYGRVCGPATTTVQLFEEETCMMDDNATPAKPSHLLDEDSQSSVRSSTNESSKMKKSKFADLFDSNKVWTAADVKEYTWPSPEGEQKVMMIQEQVAMFLGVKSFKRRYAELKRRTIVGEEREYLLSKGIVTEALCDLGITAVDASEVLDIMLSDYPHKYEEYRSHQRERKLHEAEEVVEVVKTEDKVMRVEMKVERIVEHKPEVPKVDPEKTRQDMAAAAIASAAEWNARVNASRRGACADLQSLTVQRPRARPTAPPCATVRPPAGFYPHALLPGQYQHCYRIYTPEQLRYFPLNTVMAVPPAPASVADSSSDSDGEWPERYFSSDDSDVPTHQAAKRKKITKVKRSSQAEAGSSKDGSKEGGKEGVKEEPAEGEVETCRVCKLRLEANRKYTHERFLVCSHCNAKLHPSCVELSADTIRKCREYPWQCAECKTCCSCRQPADDDKMLFCDLCDRGFHIYCVGLDIVPTGRWHCVECAVCKSCGAREPGGLGSPGAVTPGSVGVAGVSGTGVDAPQWHHQTRRGPGGHKVYSHSLCTPCARVR